MCDIAGMSKSIEIRVPLLDFKLLNELNHPKINKKMKDLTYLLPENFINQIYLDKLWHNFENSKWNQTYKLWILGCLSGWIDSNDLSLNM